MIPEGFRGRAGRVALPGFEAAARAAGIDLYALLAVWEVECGGEAFLPDGRPAVLFEAHIFSRLTQRKFDGTHPHLSRPRWDRSLYSRTRSGEYGRLVAALTLDWEAALKAASWGGSQILGANHTAAGFETVDAMVAAFCDGEAAHLSGFLAFCQTKGLVDHLKAQDWARFAAGYNGSAYRENRYDEKLAAAHARAVGALRDGSIGPGDRGEIVRRAQLLLVAAGEQVEPDGVWGRMSGLATERLQAQAGLLVTGRIDSDTQAALQAMAQGRG